MKTKVYQKPTMEVIECEQEEELLVGSVQSHQTSVQDYGWNEYGEE